MKITDVKLLVLEDLEAKGRGGHSIVRVGELRRIQYTQQGRRAAGRCGSVFSRCMRTKGLRMDISHRRTDRVGARSGTRRLSLVGGGGVSYDRCI